jgi:hypothetical protein
MLDHVLNENHFPLIFGISQSELLENRFQWTLFWPLPSNESLFLLYFLFFCEFKIFLTDGALTTRTEVNDRKSFKSEKTEKELVRRRDIFAI